MESSTARLVNELKTLRHTDRLMEERHGDDPWDEMDVADSIEETAKAIFEVQVEDAVTSAMKVFWERVPVSSETIDTDAVEAAVRFAYTYERKNPWLHF